MFIEPRELTTRIIDDLEALSAFLEDEVDERTHRQPDLTVDTRRCKETLLTVRVLLPKLRAVQAAQTTPLTFPRSPPVCINCD